MPKQEPGLPMVSMRAPEDLEREKAYLAELQTKPIWKRLAGYTKMSGPGWMQSAFTLGGGSLGSSLVAGALLGYAVLWVQPLAMACGVLMLSAVAYQTLSTRMRPMDAVRIHVHPFMAYGWALTSLLASMIWSLPQYNLANSVINDMTGARFEGPSTLLPSLCILAIVTWVTWNYGSSKGIRLYETVIKLFVALILVCFGLVVLRTGIDWASFFGGYFGFHLPRPGTHYPAWEATAAALQQASQVLGLESQDFMSNVGMLGFNAVIATFATAVGINMTFLFPYSLQARGWTREHRGLAQFDLWTGMLIPFVIATSFIIITAGNMLHGDRNFAPLQAPIPAQEMTQEQAGEILAAGRSIYNPQAGHLSRALQPVTGTLFSSYIFGFGVLGMTLSSITLLMLVSGFIMMELTRTEPGGYWYRIGMFMPAVGVLGPWIWSDLGFYMAVPTSVICFLFLPIAYISFFVLHNSKAYLGDARPEGTSRVLWNVGMGLAIVIVTAGSLRSVYLRIPDVMKLLGMGE